MVSQFLQTVWKLLKETFNSATEHNIALHGAGIAFYAIFSTAPLILLLLALVTFVMGEQQTMSVFSNYLRELTGPDISASLIEMSEQTRGENSGLIASIIAVLLLLFGATTVIAQLKQSLNMIWELETPNVNSIAQFFRDRFISLIIIILLSVLFLASLLFEGAITFFSDFFVTFIPGFLSPAVQIITYILSTFTSILFFTLIFRVLPDVNARWRDIFVGASVTTVLFLLGKYLIGLYLFSSAVQPSYKAAGSFIIFLIWIYYNVQIVLIGAEFTRAYAQNVGKGLHSSWLE